MLIFDASLCFFGNKKMDIQLNVLSIFIASIQFIFPVFSCFFFLLRFIFRNFLNQEGKCLFYFL